MKTTFAQILLMAAAALAVGCQRPGSTTVIVERDVPAPQQPVANNTEGPIASGGDNTLNGRPLESYKVRDILERDEISKHVLPVIREVAKLNRRFAAAMLHVLRERSWYMVPVTLDRIPSIKIGVHFQTEQAALHKLKEIWIDALLYDAMKDEDDKVRLWIHEIVMGVRVIRFTGSLDRCLAVAMESVFDGSKKGTHELKRKECFEAEKRRLQTGGGLEDLLGQLRLSEADYADIRKLTDSLMHNLEDVDSSELDLWLEDNRMGTGVDAKTDPASVAVPGTKAPAPSDSTPSDASTPTAAPETKSP